MVLELFCYDFKIRQAAFQNHIIIGLIIRSVICTIFVLNLLLWLEGDFRFITDELHFKTIQFIVQITAWLYCQYVLISESSSMVSSHDLSSSVVWTAQYGPKKYMQIRNWNPQSKWIFRRCLNVINMIPHILQPCASCAHLCLNGNVCCNQILAGR